MSCGRKDRTAFSGDFVTTIHLSIVSMVFLSTSLLFSTPSLLRFWLTTDEPSLPYSLFRQPLRPTSWLNEVPFQSASAVAMIFGSTTDVLITNNSYASTFDKRLTYMPLHDPAPSDYSNHPVFTLSVSGSYSAVWLNYFSVCFHLARPLSQKVLPSLWLIFVLL